jgi:hypothetical protein
MSCLWAYTDWQPSMRRHLTHEHRQRDKQRRCVCTKQVTWPVADVAV